MKNGPNIQINLDVGCALRGRDKTRRKCLTSTSKWREKETRNVRHNSPSRGREREGSKREGSEMMSGVSGEEEGVTLTRGEGREVLEERRER